MVDDGYVFDFGKYKDKSLWEVAREDFEYLEWCSFSNTLDVPENLMKSLFKYSETFYEEDYEYLEFEDDCY